MKKIAFLAALLAACATMGRAQESRQDISLSAFGLVEPFMASSTTVQVNSTPAYGGLLSYRFMLTPTSALEANYGMTYENKIGYFANPNHYNILTRTQEISGAFVKSFVYKNLNPFAEAGPAAIDECVSLFYSLLPHSRSAVPCFSSYSGGPTVTTKYDAGSLWLAL